METQTVSLKPLEEGPLVSYLQKQKTISLASVGANIITLTPAAPETVNLLAPVGRKIESYTCREED